MRKYLFLNKVDNTIDIYDCRSGRNIVLNHEEYDNIRGVVYKNNELENSLLDLNHCLYYQDRNNIHLYVGGKYYKFTNKVEGLLSRIYYDAREGYLTLIIIAYEMAMSRFFETDFEDNSFVYKLCFQPHFCYKIDGIDGRKMSVGEFKRLILLNKGGGVFLCIS